LDGAKVLGRFKNMRISYFIMKLAHTITLSVFSKDDREASKKALIGMLPFSLEDEKLKLDVQKAEGMEKNLIMILKLRLTKARHTNAFLKSLTGKLSDDTKQLLLRQLESRLDGKLDFFLRFDKQKLLQGQYCLTDSGDCFHIRMAIAAFPRKKEIAKKIVIEIFS